MNTDSGVISEGLIPASNLLLILVTDILSLSKWTAPGDESFATALPWTPIRVRMAP
jgi:hypothetical protein